jgi:hypothetical protein
MTDEDLQAHVGNLVVVKFTNGQEVLGKLVDDAPLPGCRYAIEQLKASLDPGTNWIGIPDAGDVEWIRPLTEAPEMVD